MKEYRSNFFLYALLANLYLLSVMGYTFAKESSSAPILESVEQLDTRMAWWREAKFGMFIHWGIYAIPAGEWHGKQYPRVGEWIMNWAKIPVEQYEKLTPQFNPIKFDPDQWARIAQDAGMKYVVITSKHHDGFCLFDSAATDWDVVDSTPYGSAL